MPRQRMAYMRSAPGVSMDISWCKRLTTLEGAPAELRRVLNCNHCTSLTTIEAVPLAYRGNVITIHCTSLVA